MWSDIVMVKIVELDETGMHEVSSENIPKDSRYVLVDTETNEITPISKDSVYICYT